MSSLLRSLSRVHSTVRPSSPSNSTRAITWHWNALVYVNEELAAWVKVDVLVSIILALTVLDRKPHSFRVCVRSTESRHSNRLLVDDLRAELQQSVVLGGAGAVQLGRGGRCRFHHDAACAVSRRLVLELRHRDRRRCRVVHRC